MVQTDAAAAFAEFVAVIKALRTPGTGCPWDLEQDHRTLRPYLIEEAYEVLDAIDRTDDPALQEELGDLLLQVVLHAQVAADRGAFAIAEVVRGITQKMVRRHPHVFGSEQVSGSAEVLRNWEQIKAAERQAAGKTETSAVARVPEGLPALLRAQRLGAKAAKEGIAFESADSVDEIRQWLASLEKVLETEKEKLPEERREPVAEGLGEILFGLCQMARQFGIDAEESLRACNRRFVEGLTSEIEKPNEE